MQENCLPIASLDKIRIVRSGMEAIIESTAGQPWTVHFRMGAELNQMTDHEILERWNDYVASVELSSQSENVSPSKN